MKKPFIPQQVPFKINDEHIIKLYKLALDARVKISEFNILLERSIVSESAIMYFSMHESIESTKIEGTQATFNDVMESEITGTKSNDVQEVLNYLEALQHGEIRLKSLPISTRLFHELHSIILKDSRGQHHSPGEYRKIQNFIGPTSDIKDASYIPPEPHLVSELISNLENYANNDEADDLDILIKAGIIHAQFETIHPYLDGNGRLGRILIILYLLDKQVITRPSFFLSEELEKNKFKYYGLLNNLRSDTPNWFNWLEFFLTSALKQANKYVDKLVRIESRYNEILEIAEEHSIRTDLVKIIFDRPYFTIPDIQKLLDVSYNTANSHVNKLAQLGIIYPDDKVRNKIYRFYDIIDILNN